MIGPEAAQPILACLGGSLRERSLSRAILKFAGEAAAQRGFRVEMLDVRDLNLPMYVPDLPLEEYPTYTIAAIQHLLNTCRAATAMVWSSPCYHGTVSGVFKNALDFFEYMQDDPRPYLHGCAVGLIAINDTVTFSAMGSCVHELRGWLAPTQILVNKTNFANELGTVDGKTQGRLHRLVDELYRFELR